MSLLQVKELRIFFVFEYNNFNFAYRPNTISKSKGTIENAYKFYNPYI